MPSKSKTIGEATQDFFKGKMAIKPGDDPVARSSAKSLDTVTAAKQVLSDPENFNVTPYQKEINANMALDAKKQGILEDLKAKNSLYEFLDNDDIILNELANQNSAAMMNFNASEAEKARKWQTDMSNTSHQREVADLRAAGLNPVLSANSGATAYTTSSASSTIDSAIGALANKEISRLTTAATVKAAEISAEMVGKAAEISAEASKYASNMAYKSTKYSANKGLSGAQAAAAATRAAAGATAAATKYAADTSYAAQKYNTDNTRSGTLWGTIGSGVSNDSKVGKAIKKGLDWLSGK